MKNLLPALCLCLAVTELFGNWEFVVPTNAPRVVSMPVTKAWVSMMETNAVAAVLPDGKTVQVPDILDTTGNEPELVWLADGHQRFTLVPKRESSAVLVTDLAVSTDADGNLLVRNSFFSLRHPAKGKGGFPEHLCFERNGQTDDGLYFLDRIVRKKAAGGLEVFAVEDDRNSSSRVLLVSPLRVVIEVDATVEKARFSYHYIYTPFTPVVRVEMRCAQDTVQTWTECHFLHASWKEARYANYFTAGMDKPTAINPKGAKSKSFASDRWAVYTDGTNAVGVASDFYVTGWDASDEFVYYVVAARNPWGTREMERCARLYFGPAQTREGFDHWFGRDVFISATRDGRAWTATEPLATRPDGFLLKGRSIRIAFDTAANGFNCLGIENGCEGTPVAFGKAGSGQPAFWSLRFIRDKEESTAVTLDNLLPCRKTVSPKDGSISFSWEGLDLAEEKGAVDAAATVTLNRTGDAAEWTFRVINRSKRWSLASTEYPILPRLAGKGSATALVPTGNWGGRLIPHYSSGGRYVYPCGWGSLQTIAFLLGDRGLQITALDSKAQEKAFDVSSSLDLRPWYRCPDSGVPSAGNAPAYAVETAAFAGDWMTAAKRYRAWATKQKWTGKGPLAKRADFSKRLADIGFWMNYGGNVNQITNFMDKVAKAMPDVPFGVHWYCWHTIPFDNSYPEYFPAKPGVRESVAWMKSRGITVMPYINSRLWDRDIPSFSNAVSAACKQLNGKDFYVETYGSGRSLVPMCPATKLWQEKIAQVCSTLMDGIGVNAIYLDQIAAALPAACHDTTHNHTLGGGAYWTAGYRELLTRVRDMAVKRGVALTTECTAEPYMDNVDAFLAWTPRFQEDVPLLPAVYSGYAVYFSSPEHPADSLDAFCAQQGRDFLWGCQLGWNTEWILDNNHRGHLAFETALCRERIARKDFLVYGELLGELPTPNDIPMMDVLWNRESPHHASLPAVMGTLWADTDHKRACVFLVNISGAPQKFTFRPATAAAFPWPRENGLYTVTLPPRTVQSAVADQ
jgi:hypothetical protein